VRRDRAAANLASPSFTQSRAASLATVETPSVRARSKDLSAGLRLLDAALSAPAHIGGPKASLCSARNLLVDVRVDLDIANPRDYPYLAYFADPDEWMIFGTAAAALLAAFLFSKKKTAAAMCGAPSRDELKGQGA